MILDRLSEAAKYEPLHSLFSQAFEWLRNSDLKGLTPGKYELAADKLYALVSDDQGRTMAGAKLESHRRYLDIQYVVHGDEVIGWRPLAACSQIDQPYDATRDIMFFADKPETWLALAPGTFTVFWPCDVHAPLAASGAVRKVVIKVAISD